MRILVVDDSRAMRMLVTRALRQAGFGEHTVEEAADGAAALDMVCADPPDLVLSDWHMPELSGLDLLVCLRAAQCAVQFGFVTVEATPAMRNLAAEKGADFLIPKPFTPEAFRDALTTVLS